MKKTVAIAVFGISGVGKTRLVSEFVLGNGDYLHAQASELIKRGLQAVVDSNVLRTASAAKIANNQLGLIHAYDELRKANPNQHVLFDGHSVIDTDKGLVDIDIGVIKSLDPALIVFIEDAVEAIVAR